MCSLNGRTNSYGILPANALPIRYRRTSNGTGLLCFVLWRPCNLNALPPHTGVALPPRFAESHPRAQSRLRSSGKTGVSAGGCTGLFWYVFMLRELKCFVLIRFASVDCGWVMGSTFCLVIAAWRRFARAERRTRCARTKFFMISGMGVLASVVLYGKRMAPVKAFVKTSYRV